MYKKTNIQHHRKGHQGSPNPKHGRSSNGRPAKRTYSGSEAVAPLYKNSINCNNRHSETREKSQNTGIGTNAKPLKKARKSKSRFVGYKTLIGPVIGTAILALLLFTGWLSAWKPQGGIQLYAIDTKAAAESSSNIVESLNESKDSVEDSNIMESPGVIVSSMHQIEEAYSDALINGEILSNDIQLLEAELEPMFSGWEFEISKIQDPAVRNRETVEYESERRALQLKLAQAWRASNSLTELAIQIESDVSDVRHLIQIEEYQAAAELWSIRCDSLIEESEAVTSDLNDVAEDAQRILSSYEVRL